MRRKLVNIGRKKSNKRVNTNKDKNRTQSTKKTLFSQNRTKCKKRKNAVKCTQNERIFMIKRINAKMRSFKNFATTLNDMGRFYAKKMQIF